MRSSVLDMSARQTFGYFLFPSSPGGRVAPSTWTFRCSSHQKKTSRGRRVAPSSPEDAPLGFTVFHHSPGVLTAGPARGRRLSFLRSVASALDGRSLLRGRSRDSLRRRRRRLAQGETLHAGKAEKERQDA